MNITLNIPNSDITITVQGTDAELYSILQMLLQLSKPLTKPLVSPSPVAPLSKPVTSSLPAEVPNARAFIASIYVYKSNVNSPHGRPRYAAEMLLDGKPHSMLDIAKQSKASSKSILSMIRSLRRAGAEIVIDNTSPSPARHTYTLVSVPDKKYRVRKRSNAGKPIKTTVKTSTDLKASSILSGKKV